MAHVEKVFRPLDDSNSSRILGGDLATLGSSLRTPFRKSKKRLADRFHRSRPGLLLIECQWPSGVGVFSPDVLVPVHA